MGASNSKKKMRVKVPTYEPVHKKIASEHRMPEKNEGIPDVRCHNCGAKIHPRFRYCPGCGSRLK